MSALLGMIISGASFAVTFTIDWHKVAGGGGTSADGFYTLSGTLGQAEAGQPMSGGIYAVTGGAQFGDDGSDGPTVPLRIIAVQLGPRELHITMAGTPGHTFQLQSAASLTQPIAWSNLGASALAPGEGRLEFVDPSAPGARFYRITEPSAP